MTLVAERAADDAGDVDRAVAARLDAAVEGARRGDERAFSDLFALVQPRLLRYLYARAGGDAADLASETWARVIADLHKFDGNGQMFLRWIFTIGRCRAADLRRKPRDASVGLADVDPTDTARSAEDTALANLSMRALLAAVATLPADQADAVTLRHVAALDTATAAAVLGKSPEAVRVNCHRGLRRLAALLTAAGEGVA